MKKKILSVMAASLFLTGCSIGGDKKGEKIEVQDDMGTVENVENSGVESGIFEDSKRATLEYIQPFYTAQLSSKALFAYDEIVNAARNQEKDIILSSKISVSDLKKIMKIIYTEEAELFHLEPKYGYTSDDGNSVSIVSLNYTQLKEGEYEKGLSTLESMKNNIVKNKDKPYIYDIQQELFKLLIEKDYLNDKGFDASRATSSKLNSLGFAKLSSYLLRANGVNATIVAGEPTTNKFSNELDLFKGSFEAMKEVEKHEKDSQYYEVTLDIGNMYYWNMIEINGSWYNFDIPFTVATAESLETNIPKQALPLLMNVPDTLIAQTRMQYKAEDILGVNPSSQNKMFQFLYRDKQYISNEDIGRFEEAVFEQIYKMGSANRKYIVIQFENDKLLNTFKDKIDSIILNFGSEHEMGFSDYKLEYIDVANTAIIYDIVINEK